MALLIVVGIIALCTSISVLPVKAALNGQPMPRGWTLGHLLFINAGLLAIGFAGTWKSIRDIFTVFGDESLEVRSLSGRRERRWFELRSYELTYPVLTLVFASGVERINVLTIANVGELETFLREKYENRER